MQNNIRLLRKARGWSMRELGERMGIHFSTVAKLEKSERKLTAEWAAKFAKTFGVNVWDVTDADAYGIPNPKDLALSVIELSNARNWRDELTNVHEYLPPADGRASEWAFYVHVNQNIPDDIFPKDSYVLIETTDRDLIEGHYYSVVLDNKCVRFVEYASPPARFLSCSQGTSETVLMLGHDPFVTMGRILGYYVLFPTLGK